MDILEEYDLLEWGYYGRGYHFDPVKHGQDTFWDKAAEKILAVKEFHTGYDKKLKELGLDGLFDKTSGLLLNRGTYGKIKQGYTDFPDAGWCIKALAKFWALQFVDNARLLSDVEEEERKEREARYEKERQEREEQARKDQAELETYIPRIQKLVDEKCKEFANKYAAEITSNYEKVKVLATEVLDLFYNDPHLYGGRYVDKSHYEDRLSGNDECKIDIRVYNSVTLEIKVEKFLGYASFHGYVWEPKPNYLHLTLEMLRTMDDAAILNDLGMLFTQYADIAVNASKRALDTYTEYKEDLVSKRKVGKDAQAAADAGKPNAKFASMIVGALQHARQAGSDAFDSWAGSTDGSDGAAQAMAVHGCLRSMMPYLMDCNWRAVVKDKEIVRCKAGADAEVLYDAIGDAYSALCPELDIEIIPTKDYLDEATHFEKMKAELEKAFGLD